MDLSFIPWFAWIAIVGIVFWGLIELARVIFGRSKKMEELSKSIQESSALTRALVAKMDGIDERLGAVEKTLNDIP